MVATFERMSCALRDLLRFIVPFDRTEAWKVDGATSMPNWLTFRFAISISTAREWVHAAHALEELPAIAEAFAEGLICWEKLRLLIQIATPDNDRFLADTSHGPTLAEVERYVRLVKRISRDEANEQHRKRVMHTYWDRDGMFNFWGRLYGAEGAVVEKALDRVCEQIFPQETRAGMYRPHTERLADAFVEVCSSNHAADADSDRATVVCYVDEDVLASRDGNGMLDRGVAVPADAVRRMACDGRKQLVYTGADGRPVGIGRASRTVPAWLSRLIQHRDYGCRWEGCGRNRGVQAHHVRHWADGGPTDADNLISLCRFHHRLVHEGGWELEMSPVGGLLIRRPDGSPLSRHSQQLVDW